MSVEETIVTCQNCEHENEFGQRFCDECGAELSPAPDAVSQPDPAPSLRSESILNTNEGAIIKVVSNISLGRLSRYSCSIDGAPGLLIEESASALGLLASRLQCLSGLSNVEQIWRPLATFRSQEHNYAVGTVPDFPTLTERIKNSGSFTSDEIRKLALSLGAVLAEVHGQGFLIRSFHPDRLWWNGEGLVVIDSLERLVAAALASEDFQVINGFSPPEAYGVGASPLGIQGDLFSLGAILHFAASGRKTDLESRESFFVFPDLLNLEDEVLKRTIELLTAKDASDRPQDVKDFLDILALKELPKMQPEVSLSSVSAPSCAPAEANAAKATAYCEYQVCLRSHVGCVRQINQDACLEMRFSSIEKSLRHDTHLLVMIDGMGGEAEGDKAASLALRTIAQDVVSSKLTLMDQRVTSPLLPNSVRDRNLLLLERALKKANRTIYDYAERNINRQGMGCTITACILEPSDVYIGHVGDTRAYLWRKGELKKLTTDHSLVGRLVEMGQLTEEEARNSPQRSIIYRAMGTNPDVEVDLYHQDLVPGDRLMVSSDGVWEYFTSDELQQILADHNEPVEAAERLIEVCLSRGADDNATVAIVNAK